MAITILAYTDTSIIIITIIMYNKNVKTRRTDLLKIVVFIDKILIYNFSIIVNIDIC